MISKCLSTSEKRAALHQQAGKLAEFCQALYPLLVAHADDWGRLVGDAFTVKYSIDPTSPRPVPDFAAALTALHEVGLIVWYEAVVGDEPRRLIYIRGWFAHQQLKGHDKNGRESQFPSPSENISNSVEVAKSRPDSPKPALTRTRTRTRREEEDLELERSIPVEREPESPQPAALRAAPSPAQEFISAWNTETQSPIARCRDVTPARKSKINARLRERPLEEWREVFRRIQSSDFCRGENDRGWSASFDWVIGNADNALKVLEGKYDNRPRLVKPRAADNDPYPSIEDTNRWLADHGYIAHG